MKPNKGKATRGRGAFAIVAVAALLFAIVMSLSHRETVASATPRVEPAERASSATRPPWLRAEPLFSPSVKVLAANEKIRAFSIQQLELLEKDMRHLQMRINYPLWSSPLDPMDVYEKPISKPGEVRGPNNSEPTMKIWSDNFDYHPGDPIHIYALLTDKGTPVVPEPLVGKINQNERARPDLPINFNDAGQDGDTRAGDGIYTATLNIPADVAKRERGLWSYIVNAGYPNTETRNLVHYFRIQAPDAVVVGNYREALEEGSLVVYVDINVINPSIQHLRAELWQGDSPLTYAWHVEENLAAGPHTFKLTFYGRTIRDLGLDGPYTVRNLRLRTLEKGNVDEFEDPAIDPVLTTAAYQASAFTDVPINGDNAILLAKENALKSNIALLQGGTVDPANPPKGAVVQLAGDKHSYPVPQ